MAVTVETLVYSLSVILICLLIGFAVAYSLVRIDALRLRLVIVMLPLTLSLVVVIFACMVLPSSDGLINSSGRARHLKTAMVRLHLCIEEYLHFECTDWATVRKRMADVGLELLSAPESSHALRYRAQGYARPLKSCSGTMSKHSSFLRLAQAAAEVFVNSRC